MDIHKTYCDHNFIMLYTLKWTEVKVAQSCPTLWDPMDYTVHGTLQARILECVAFPFSRGSSQPRDKTQVCSTAGGFFTNWATREALHTLNISINLYVNYILIKLEKNG